MIVDINHARTEWILAHVCTTVVHVDCTADLDSRDSFLAHRLIPTLILKLHACLDMTALDDIFKD